MALEPYRERALALRAQHAEAVKLGATALGALAIGAAAAGTLLGRRSRRDRHAVVRRAAPTTEPWAYSISVTVVETWLSRADGR